MSVPAVAYRFGRFRLIADERVLLVDGEPARVGARAFDLLRVLVEAGGRTVPRDELFERVWPGRVVEDQNLKVQVLALRKLLGAQAIATVPGRGYRFALALDDDAVPSARRPPPMPPAPPPRAPQSNLPTLLPALYGRVADIAALCRALATQRLVSIVGPGGIGKTRVAQAVAHQLRSRFADGVWLVELAALADGAELPATVARALGVAALPHASDDSVASALHAQSLLLVLDNCEQLLGACASLADRLLHMAPQVVLLVTSQAPLKLAGERVYRLDALDVPAAGLNAAAALERGSIALLVARVQAIDARFRLSDADVGAAIDVCRALDGIALAIELAAARVPLLGLNGVRERLGERFRLLTRGARNAPERQQTLAAALHWSHRLLSAAEQTVFRWLGVFAGSFSLEAAQRVAADAAIGEWDLLDHLGTLVERSLVAVDSGEPPRYRLLESARAFAVEQLDASGEREMASRAHLHAMLGVFRRADDDYLSTPALRWLDRVLPDLDNLRAAFEAAQRQPDTALLAVELAALGAFLYSLAGLGAEGERACRAVRAAIDDAPLALRARYWLSVAHLGVGWLSRPDPALQATQAAIALYRRLDDAPRLYFALRIEITLLERRGRLDGIDAVLAEMRGLERPDWSPLLKRLRRWTEAHHRKQAGDVRAYRDVFRDEVAQCAADGDERAAWLAAHHLSVGELALGNVDAAAAAMQAAVEQIRERGLQRQFPVQIAMLAMALVDAGHLPRAAPVLREAMSLLVINGMLWWLSDALACVPALAGDLETAARLHGWADAVSAAHAAGARGHASRRLDERLRSQLVAAFDTRTLKRLESEGATLDDDAVVALVQRALL